MVLDGSRGSCSGDTHGATLLWMELHSPGLLPCGKPVQVFLYQLLIISDDICRYSIQSSAKSLVLELMSSGRSFIKINNSTGPRTDP